METEISCFTYKGLSLHTVLMDLAVRFVLNCPEEDLSSSSRFMFQVEEAHWFYEDFCREENPELPRLTIYHFVDTLYTAVPLLKAICENWQQALVDFKKYKQGIPVRGGIILNEKNDKVLLVSDWNQNGWSFPRGKINKEEEDMTCAIREVYEETGFNMGPYIQDPQDYLERNIGDKNFRLYIAMHVPSDTKFETRTRKEISDIQWFPLSVLMDSKKKRKGGHNTYLTNMFFKQLKNFIKTKKRSQEKIGKAAKVSKSNDLKSLLGIPVPQPAQELLSIIKPQSVVPSVAAQPSMMPYGYPMQYPMVPPTPQTVMAQPEEPKSDKDVLKQLMEEGKPLEETDIRASKQLSSANKILALLKKEYHETQAHSSTPEVDGSSETPALPPNSMLEKLVTSRKELSRKPRSSMPTRKPVLPQTTLLKVLNSENYSKQPPKQQRKLIDLLNAAPTPEKSAKPAKREVKNSLMDLLDSTSGKSPEIANARDNKRSQMPTSHIDSPESELETKESRLLVESKKSLSKDLKPKDQKPKGDLKMKAPKSKDPKSKDQKPNSHTTSDVKIQKGNESRDQKGKDKGKLNQSLNNLPIDKKRPNLMDLLQDPGVEVPAEPEKPDTPRGSILNLLSNRPITEPPSPVGSSKKFSMLSLLGDQSIKADELPVLKPESSNLTAVEPPTGESTQTRSNQDVTSGPENLPKPRVRAGLLQLLDQ